MSPNSPPKASSLNMGSTSTVQFSTTADVVSKWSERLRGRLDSSQAELLIAVMPHLADLLTTADYATLKTRVQSDPDIDGRGDATGSNGEPTSVPVINGTLGIPPVEAHHVFASAFMALLAVFAKPEHPLVLFLDDVQWIDVVSLDLIRRLHASNLTMLCICAYRSNEVDLEHPFLRAVGHMIEADVSRAVEKGVIGDEAGLGEHKYQLLSKTSQSEDVSFALAPRINLLQLPPLTQEHVAELLADTLCTSDQLEARRKRMHGLPQQVDMETGGVPSGDLPAEKNMLPAFHPGDSDVDGLATLLHSQTQGNAFYLQSLLTAYHDESLIRFDFEAKMWTWSTAELRVTRIANVDSVIDLLCGVVAQLPHRQQLLLQRAACIGNTCTLQQLTVISASSDVAVASMVFHLCQLGYLVPLQPSNLLFAAATGEDTHAGGFFSPSHGSSEPKHQPQQTLSFRFQHDSVQQSCYQLMSPAVACETHLRIARLFDLQGTTASISKLLSSGGIHTPMYTQPYLVSEPAATSMGSTGHAHTVACGTLPEWSQFIYDITEQYNVAAKQFLLEKQAQLGIGKASQGERSHVMEVSSLSTDASSPKRTFGAPDPALEERPPCSRRPSGDTSDAPLSSEEELLRIIELNILAGEGAESNTAYQAALKYLQLAHALWIYLDALDCDDEIVTPSSSSDGMTGINKAQNKTSLWVRAHHLSMSLHLHFTRALVMTEEFDRAERISSIGLAHCQTVTEEVAMLRLQVQMYIFQQSRTRESLTTGLKVLPMMGIELLDSRSEEALLYRYRDPTALLSGPLLTDPVKAEAMEMIVSLLAPCFQLGELGVMEQLLIYLLRNSFDSGIHSSTAFVLVMRMFFDWREKRMVDCALAGKISQQLLSERPDLRVSAHKRIRIVSLYHHFAHWQLPIASMIEPMTSLASDGLACGETEYSGYCFWIMLYLRFYSGEPLRALEHSLSQLQASLLKQRRPRHASYCHYTLRMVHHLLASPLPPVPHHSTDAPAVPMEEKPKLPSRHRGQASSSFRRKMNLRSDRVPSTFEFNGTLCRDCDVESYLIAGSSNTWLCHLHELYMIYAVMHRCWEHAYEESERARVLLSAVPGMYDHAINNFFQSFILLSAVRPLKPNKDLRSPITEPEDSSLQLGTWRSSLPPLQLEYSSIFEYTAVMKAVEENQQRLLLWSEYCPANYAHKHALIEAEVLRVKYQQEDAHDLLLHAMDAYDRAIRAAQQHGMMQEKAQAMECAARFYLSLTPSRPRESRRYWWASYLTYRKWGCRLKVELMEREFPDMCQEQQERMLSPMAHRSSTSVGGDRQGGMHGDKSISRGRSKMFAHSPISGSESAADEAIEDGASIPAYGDSGAKRADANRGQPHQQFPSTAVVQSPASGQKMEYSSYRPAVGSGGESGVSGRAQRSRASYLEDAADYDSDQNSARSVSTDHLVDSITECGGSNNGVGDYGGTISDFQPAGSSGSYSTSEPARPIVKEHHSRSQGHFQSGVDINLLSVMKACAAFSVIIDSTVLHHTLMRLILQTSCATRVRLVLRRDIQGAKEAAEGGGENIVSEAAVGVDHDLTRMLDQFIPKLSVFLSGTESVGSNASSGDAPDRRPTSSSSDTKSSYTPIAISASVTDGCEVVVQATDGIVITEWVKPDRLAVGRAAPLSVLNVALKSRTAVLVNKDDLEPESGSFGRDPYFHHSSKAAKSKRTSAEEDAYFVENGKISPCTEVMHTQPNTNSVRVFEEEAVRNSLKEAKQRGPKSGLCLPLLRQSSCVGFVWFESDSYARDAFSVELIQLLQVIVAQAVMSMENAALYSAMKRSAEEAQAGSKAKTFFITNMSHEVRSYDTQKKALCFYIMSMKSSRRYGMSLLSSQIRTPMNAVLGVSRLLAETQLTLEQQQYVEMIMASGGLLLGIINDVIDLSRIESGALSLESAPFRLASTLEQVVSMLLPLSATKGIDLALLIDPMLPDVLVGDAVRLQQIVTNLLANAVKFTGGSVNNAQLEKAASWVVLRVAAVNSPPLVFSSRSRTSSLLVEPPTSTPIDARVRATDTSSTECVR